MRFFSQLHKPAFWSQFLLGMVAILALPAVANLEERHAEPVADQQILRLSDLSALKLSEIEQTFFLQQVPQSFTIQPKQAVEFCEFFAKPYRLLSLSQPPIRAGPFA